MKGIGNGKQDVQRLLPKTWKSLLYGTTNIFCFYLVTNALQLPSVYHEKLFYEKLKWIFECLFGNIHLS